MGKLLRAFLMLFLLAGSAHTRTNTLGIYEDPSGSNCNLTAISGVVHYYVVFYGTLNMRTISFSAPKPECMANAIHLADTYDGIYIVPPGNSQDGITLSHFNCEPSPVAVMSITYFMTLPAQNCCYYPVLSHPQAASGLIEAADCSADIFYPEGLIGVVNDDGSCPCDLPIIIPVDATTWGQIKRLYLE